MINSKGKKSATASSSKLPLRIALKCSWSGSRIETPNSLSALSTLSDVIFTVASQLPDLFSSSSEQHQPSIVYLRTTVWKKDWSSTTIAQMLGDDCFGSVLMTLNLPDVSVPSFSKPTTETLSQKISARPNVEHTPSVIAPMEIDDENIVSNPVATSNAYTTTMSEPDSEIFSIHDTPIFTPKDAVHKLLRLNFDIASKECLLTILKIIDNILSKPQNSKVRSIRLANPTIHDKIRSKKGGLDVLFSIGFTMEQSFSSDLDPKIILCSENENTSILLYTRRLLEQVLVNTLGVASEDIPPFHQSTSTEMLTQNSMNTPVSFDPYRPFTFNVQSAAAGAPNPASIVPEGVIGPSLTEQRLDQLKKKQMKIEEDLFRQNTIRTVQDRNLVVYPPPIIPTGAIVTVSAQDESDATFLGSSKGDASLIAGRLKRLEDERKKREEGGFTTSAMREVDKLMNTKIYSHTQVRIDFPDGSWVSAKFLPYEKVSVIKETLRSIFVAEYLEMPFDLYITPPKRILIDENTLTEEGLVPAAKIRFTWKHGNNVIASFIQPEFFINGIQNTGFAYPESMPIVETKNNNYMKVTPVVGESNSSVSVDPSKEDELVRRMLGKQSFVLRPKEQR